jgi:predicted acyltransferase
VEARPLRVNRLLSLDVFRGLTIAGMILVNSPGNGTAYAQLEHAEWNGCTLTDLVFPFFLFIVGVSLVFSFTKRRERRESDARLLRRVFRRALIIFSLGLVLNGFPHAHLSTLRIPGVLQRIALCYFFASLLYLKTSIRTLAAIFAILLAGYWLLMTRAMAPGLGAGDLTREGNLAAFVDRALLSGHMYRPVYDPEGVLSTLPAIATVLLGVFSGRWLQSSFSGKDKALGLLAAGAAGVMGGRFWNASFPLNKALWTSSYVLFTGGLALILLAVCYWLIEVRGWRAWGRPFEILGVNAIAAYILHILFLKIQNLILMPQPDGAPGNLRFFITNHLFGWASPKDASLLYALSYTFLWLGVFTVLYRKQIFIKI